MNLAAEGFDNDFQARHPRDSQMAVLKQNPATLGFGFINHTLCFLVLTLSERDHVCSLQHVFLLSELLEVSYRIRTRAEYEDQRSDLSRVLVTSSDVECWWVNEFLSDLLYNVILDSKSYLVRSDSFEHDHLLEGVKSAVPLSWQRFILGLCGVEDLLELLVELDEVSVDAFEGLQVSHHIELPVDLSPF